MFYFRIRSISRSALGYFQSCQKFHGKNGKKNSYVAFNKMQSCSANAARTFAVRWGNDNKFSTCGRNK